MRLCPALDVPSSHPRRKNKQTKKAGVVDAQTVLPNQTAETWKSGNGKSCRQGWATSHVTDRYKMATGLLFFPSIEKKQTIFNHKGFWLPSSVMYLLGTIGHTPNLISHLLHEPKKITNWSTQ